MLEDHEKRRYLKEEIIKKQEAKIKLLEGQVDLLKKDDPYSNIETIF